MVLFLLFLLAAFVFFGLGFVVKWLFILALIFLVIAVVTGYGNGRRRL